MNRVLCIVFAWTAIACGLALAEPPVEVPDFVQPQRWTSTRDSKRLGGENHYYRFFAAQDTRFGQVLRWEFQIRRPEQGFNDLFSLFPIDRPFDEIRMWVRNNGTQPVKFFVKLVDADDGEFAPRPLGVRLEARPEWQQVVFRAGQFATAPWYRGRVAPLEPPIKSLVLVVVDVKAEEKHQFDFAGLELMPARPKRIRVLEVKAPDALEAGQDFQARLALSADEPLADEPLVLSLVCGSQLYRKWREPLPKPTHEWRPGERIQLTTAPIHFPRYAPGGRYTLQARLGWTTLARNADTGSLASVEIHGRRPGPLPKAEVRPHNGVPTLWINGVPDSGMCFMTYNQREPKYFADFGRAGVNLATFSATSDYSYYSLAPPTWLAPGVFDYGRFDERIGAILEANPQAWIFPRIYLAAPPWWAEKNPDEMAAEADHWSTDEARDRGKPFASPASKKWRADTAEALRRFIEHVRAAPYADRVIGYHIASLHTEEWFWHGFWLNPPSYWGYDRPSREAFREFLRRRYPDVAALRAAWNDPRVDFDSADVPSKQQRATADLGFFRDPAKSRPVIDFYRFYNELVVETIEYFARVVKGTAGRDKLCGAFYGYMFELAGSPESGHMALERLLRSPDVDFLCAPSCYNFRELGTGTSVFMSLTESIRHHGKLWFDENDYRTHRVKDHAYRMPTSSLAESLAIQRRELAYVISQGAAMWWFDMSGGWYDEPPFMAEIARFNHVAQRSIDFDRSSAAEIAVVLDEESMDYRQSRGRLAEQLIDAQRLSLQRIGAPYDGVLLNDLATLRPYKLYIFLNTIRVTPQQRAVIDRVVRRAGRTALWVYGPGFVGEKLTEEGISSLVGMKIGRIDEAQPVRVQVAQTSDVVTRDRPVEAKWGDSHKIQPVFFCDDPAATPLGTIEGLGKTGLAVRRFGDWTSVWAAAPNLPAWLLRSIARSAGVHVFSAADDALYANRSFLAIHTNAAGPRRLQFAAPTSLYEVLDGRQVARDATEVTVDLPAQHTALYFLGTGERWNRGP
jgi:hypothetical protein